MTFLLLGFNFCLAAAFFCSLQLFLCLVTFFRRSCLLRLSFAHIIVCNSVLFFAVFVLSMFFTYLLLLNLYFILLFLLFGLGYCKLLLLLSKGLLLHLGLFLSFFLSLFFFPCIHVRTSVV